MDSSPLVIDEIEAGAEFLRRLDVFKRIKAACWLRSAENEERYLYVALEGLTETDFDNAYGEVRRITDALQDHYVDPFRVKLIGPNHAIAKAISEVHQRHPGRNAPRINGRSFAGESIADVYIYPPLAEKPQ